MYRGKYSHGNGKPPKHSHLSWWMKLSWWIAYLY